MFSVSHCSTTEIFIFPEGKSMIPNGCINFNVEIQFKEDFIEVQFPENVWSLLSQAKFFFFFPSGTVNHLPFGLALLISFHKDRQFSRSNMKSTSQIQMYAGTWETRRRYWRQRHVRTKIDLYYLKSK